MDRQEKACVDADTSQPETRVRGNLKGESRESGI